MSVETHATVDVPVYWAAKANQLLLHLNSSFTSSD